MFIILQRLEGGLYNLQQAAIILAFACVFEPRCLQKAELKLSAEGASLEDVQDTLREMLLTLQTMNGDDQEEGSESNGTTGGSGKDSGKGSVRDIDSGGASSLDSDEKVDARFKLLLTEWCAALSKLISEQV